MVHGLGLVSDLETRTPHAEVHRIHVNLAWKWLILGLKVHVCFLILVQRYFDANFLCSSFSYALGNS
jgi:hypothetical protein